MFNLYVECAYSEDDKTLWMFYSDIAYISVKLIIHTLFFLFTTFYFKIPFNIFRETVATVRTLNKKIVNFINYRKISKDLERCEYVKGEGTCPICMNDMEIGKAVRCGHVFHMSCLKRWVERQQVCPICRQSMFSGLGEVSFSTESENLRGIPIVYDE
jgi:E3 ubiquitin-protein ligase synoviolin